MGTLLFSIVLQLVISNYHTGGHLVNILNGEKQSFLNYDVKGINYWTGLNDITQEGQFMWDGPVPVMVLFLS